MKKNKKLIIKPIDQFDGEVLGCTEIDLSLTMVDFDDDHSDTDSVTAISLFNGLGWEREIIWQVSNLLINEFGGGKDEIREALQEVHNRL